MFFDKDSGAVISDIEIIDPQLPQLGGRHSGGKKERHDCRVSKLLERRAV
ncbi:hypothetical protein [Caballeronia sp. GAFFF2]|nr:hypothetical protein [Caballeronia sp. GAFFF2]